MARGSSKAEVAFLLATCAALSQAPPPRLRFEVASIKPSLTPSEFTRQHGQPPHYIMTASRVDLQVASLAGIIDMAYKLNSYQISGPDWMSVTRFDILAKPPEGATSEQIPKMLQNLLADRFKLVAHRETKERNVYALVVGKDGPKIKEASPDAGKSSIVLVIGNEPQFPNGLGGRKILRRSLNSDGTVSYTVSILNGRTILESPKINMHDFGLTLGLYLDDPVVDLTGLTGDYEIAVDVPDKTNAGARMLARSASSDPPADATSEPFGGSILKSIQTLGLRLERRRAPVEYLIVDHLEKVPTEN
jgi:uncharacterized protein (TIGR03435 family)